MTFGVVRGVATDAAGNVVPNVWVEVRRQMPGFPLAIPLYADAAGAAGLDNPFFSASGEWQYYKVGGTDRVHAYTVGGGYDKTWDDVPVGTAQGADLNAYLGAGFTWAPESATATPPSDGSIRFSGADASLAAHIYVSKLTLGGSDSTNWVTSFQANDWLLLANDSGIEMGWPVVGVTSHTSWFDIEVATASYTGPAGPISLGDSGFITLSREKAALTTSGNTIVKTDAGDVTVGATDGVLILKKASAQATGVALPAVSTRNGLPLKVSDPGGNAGDITFTPDGSETIQGQANWIIGSGGQLTLYPNPTISGWFL